MKLYMPFPRYLSIAVLLMTGLVWSCIRDDRDDCITSYQLIVKPIASDSVRNGDISEVVLFIFDKEQKFIGSMKTGINQVTELSYPSYDELYVVAWGNITGRNQTLSPPETGKLPGQINLNLAMKDASYALPPGDLFQGAKPVNQKAASSQPDVLLIKRKVANVTVTAKGLQDYLGTTDVDFTYVIRGSSGSTDLNGVLSGNEVRLQPDAAFNVNRDFTTPAFRVFPSTHLAVDLYKGNQLVYSTDKDDAGNPFVAPEGKKLAILIDFRGNIRVTISVSNWDDTDITIDQ